MATSQLNTVFQQLRRIVLVRDGAGLTDGQLLESFVTQHDEAAFEALVRRLGPMVLKVCRRVVGNHHDAEDAFQATFLVLARKASSVKARDMVANWLHGVALRTALKARTLRMKTWMREKQVSNLPEPEAGEQTDSHALNLLLDQELSRLAEIYRLPILLCNLEGKSIKQTAQQLGWPQGTVAGRLARGKKLLAKRLARHGLATTGGVAVLENSVSACVPPSLVAATVKAASAYAAGKSLATGMMSANVAVLMEGVVKAMFLTKLKTVAGALVFLSALGIGAGTFTLSAIADNKPTSQTQEGRIPVDGPSKEKQGQGPNEDLLTKESKFAIDQACFCEWIKSFGIYKPLPEGHAFQPAELVQLYVELRNFVSQSRNGSFTVRLSSSVVIHDQKGRMVWSFGFEDGKVPIQSRTLLHDYFNNYSFYVPKNLPPGIYNLTIKVTDEGRLAQPQMASKSLEFRIGGADGEIKKEKKAKLPPISPILPVGQGQSPSEPTKDSGKTDHDKLRGRWRLSEWNSHGKTGIPSEISRWSIGKYRIVMNPPLISTTKSPTGTQYASYHLWGDHDDAASAANNINLTIDVVSTSPDGKQRGTLQQTFRGIFAFDADKLTLCFRQPEFGTRPTEIPASSSNDDSFLIVVLKRETAAPKTDEEKLQGDWRSVGGEVDGESIESEGAQRCSFVGDLMIWAKGPSESFFKLDATKNPKRIAFITKRGHLELKNAGIYALDGDELKVCWVGEKDDHPPTDFTAAKGSGREIFILKRMKSAAEGEAPGQVPGRVDEQPSKRQADQPKAKPDTGKKDGPIAKTDHDKLRGTWKVVEAKYGGGEFPLKNAQLSIGRDKIVINHAQPQNPPKERDYASYHLWGDNNDTAPAPNYINLTLQLTTPPPDNKTVVILSDGYRGILALSSDTYRGIFALEGDTLKLCVRQGAHAKRPTEIPASSSKDHDLFIWVLQRETAAPKTDEEKLQGDWEVVGGEWDGEPSEISKGTMHVSFVGDLMIYPEAEQELSYTLDATKSPKQIVQICKFRSAGRKIVGIYSLDGDELRICYTENEKAAIPDDFTAAEGSGREMLIFKRCKPRG